MQEENTNSPVATEPSASDTPTADGPFNDEVLEQLKMFVAQRMFEGVAFTQVLSTIDLQCRKQAVQRIEEASQEDLQAIFADMQESLATAYESQEAQVAAAQEQAAAASEDITAPGTQECCEKPDDCETPKECPGE